MSKTEVPKEASTEPPSKDVSLAIVAVAATGAASSVLVGVGFGWSWFVGSLVGSAIAVANLMIFKRLGEAFISNSGSGRATWGLIGALKFVVLIAIVFLLLRHRLVGAFPFVIGYAALPIGITLSSLLGARHDGGPK